MDEMLEAFSKRFDVNMDGFIWYFHHGDEPADPPGKLKFLKAPYDKVDPIPVTPEVLRVAAESGYWPIEYPEHDVGKYRWDTIVPTAFIFIVVLTMTLARCGLIGPE